MPRGYRCVLVALVGIVLAGASPPNQTNHKGEAKASQTEPPPPPYKPDPDRRSERCYENPDHEAADLCAQWSAADAAEETAGLSYWGNWIAGFGALLSFASVLLVLAALKQGREANSIAKDTAKRELRAYLITKDHAVTKLFTGGNPSFIVKIQNFGQTPASEVRVRTLVRATDGDVDEYKIRIREAKQMGGLSDTLIGPTDYHVQANAMGELLDHETWAMIIDGKLKMIFVGVISYRDVFGKRHLTTFKYFLNPGLLNIRDTTYDLSACGRGNKAT